MCPSRRLQRQLQSSLIRYWGWLALLIFLWRLSDGELDLWSVALAAVALFYFAFSAPAWCGAVIRSDQLCRRNAYGLLMGCHLREHRFQKLTLVIVPRSWRALMRRIWSNPLPTVGAVLAGVFLFLSTVGTLVQAAVAVIYHP